MKAVGTFEVIRFAPTTVTPEPEITTALPVSIATMEKRYSGQVTGRSATLFTAAFDPATASGTYVALESFDGTLHGRAGTFNFVHSAATDAGTSEPQLFLIVAGSGTGELTGITGTGGLTIDPDDPHCISFDYELS